MSALTSAIAEMSVLIETTEAELVEPSEEVVKQAVEEASQYVLDNTRRGNASLNDEQFAADTAGLMTAYRDIFTKGIASGKLKIAT
jgi:hypothetical protein